MARASALGAGQRVFRSRLFLLLLTTPAAFAAPANPIFWQETFAQPTLDWIDPAAPQSAAHNAVYSLRHEDGAAFLHAHHDRSASKTPPAIHYGKAFQSSAAPLEKVRALHWRWRVLQHPNVTDDPWVDVAASVYVIIRSPSVFHSGHGFKFGWLAKPATASHQRGLLEMSLRAAGALHEWQSESVDLCALYQKEYKRGCAGETVQYIGVMTDADNTHSIAEADYADFELALNP